MYVFFFSHEPTKRSKQSKKAKQSKGNQAEKPTTRDEPNEPKEQSPHPCAKYPDRGTPPLDVTVTIKDKKRHAGDPLRDMRHMDADKTDNRQNHTNSNKHMQRESELMKSKLHMHG